MLSIVYNFLCFIYLAFHYRHSRKVLLRSCFPSPLRGNKASRNGGKYTCDKADKSDPIDEHMTMKNKFFALVDCNNFYVSCERAFNPALEKNPVVVLSNNDGCIISRSQEAKQLKIPMGAPFFKWEFFCKKHFIHVFSSNYELYGDMSERVMSILREYNENMEVYSIDEAFLLLPSAISLTELLSLQKKIKLYTGIPVSIGVGKTKTLAKIANQIAKNSNSGVFILNQDDPILGTFPVEKIWGIGNQLGARLCKLNIHTAKKLSETDPKIIRSHFNVSVEKTVQELNGVHCFNLATFEPRKQIISSRSFGKIVTKLSDLEEAVSHYTARAVKKLRKQKSVASGLYVFLQTNIFRKDHPQYGNGVAYSLPFPTADSRYLIRLSKKCVRHLYKKSYQYHKAGVMLLDIYTEKIKQYDLFKKENDTGEKVMQLIEGINKNLKKDAIFIAAEGIKREWSIKFNKRSSRYTTRWEELPNVFCA